MPESPEFQLEYHLQRAGALVEQERYSEALEHLQAALDIDPRSSHVLIEIGDMYAYFGYELGLDTGPDHQPACEMALSCYDRALDMDWKQAEAWAGKALALQKLRQYSDCLAAADTGLFVLPLCIGRGIAGDVHTNIAETLFRCRTLALLETGRRDEAERTLRLGLDYCPGSWYLTDVVDRFLPKDQRST